MALRIVGAGLGRTGTNSLKLALEQLLGGPCYHMLELFGHLDHVPTWHRAIRGEQVEWEQVFGGYVAAVDWPTAACWRSLADTYPDALVLLSRRRDAEEWWASIDQTIFAMSRLGAPPDPGLAGWWAMAAEMLDRFEPRWGERGPSIAAYERHNEEVRRTVPPERLLEWQPTDGWAPLCERLGVPVPDQPFPHVNTEAEFRSHFVRAPAAT